jgi:aspartyl-tRNA synthetase
MGDRLNVLMPIDDDSIIEILKFRPKNVENISDLVPKLHQYSDDPSLPEVLNEAKISICTDKDLFGLSNAETEVLRDKADIREGDVVVLNRRKKTPFIGGSTPMGQIRLALHRAGLALNLLDPPEGFNFLWVTDFPLFKPSSADEPGQGGSTGLSSTHHPFTAPKTVRDVDVLQSDPASAVGAHYDLVVNGVELGGGSRRIHHADVQEFIFKNILVMPESKIQQFGHLLDVLRSGCPPHAGIALGFDRLIAIMLGFDSIRDVMAFPKTGRGEDLLVKSPSKITSTQLQTYHLDIAK